MDHPALGQSPREAFTKGFELRGSRPLRIIPYDQNFILTTMPSTPRGVALVSPSRGVKINYVYYWSDVFRDPELERVGSPYAMTPSMPEQRTPSAGTAGWIAIRNITRRSVAAQREK